MHRRGLILASGAAALGACLPASTMAIAAPPVTGNVLIDVTEGYKIFRDQVEVSLAHFGLSWPEQQIHDFTVQHLRLVAGRLCEICTTEPEATRTDKCLDAISDVLATMFEKVQVFSYAGSPQLGRTKS